jgi:hypothetical protein
MFHALKNAGYVNYIAEGALICWKGPSDQLSSRVTILHVPLQTELEQ